ncbi:hypothetical protein ACJRO7_004340 [Eucalyptus globulus]|uniref:TIR domain-containing protein n=1 Tax=Eucalyptus globulus TaxID=34317 RepID=A0ABD3IX23_EUCGL
MVLVAMKRKKDSDTTMSSSISGGDKPLGAEFEVFLNFRGPDTRLNFTDCLYHSLNGVGIRVLIHNEEIRKGEKIGEELLSVINGSKIYVSIFSINYASSAIRLTDKVIIPIFFNVDPCDVKLRTGLYVDALKRHKDKFSYDEVQQWKVALIEVASIKGWHCRDRGSEGARVVRDHLVGIDYHVQNVIYMLGEDSLDVQFVIIHGLGGINKTTLANVVFNHITSQFDGCSFLSDILQFSQQGKIVKLQKRLLSDILKSESLKVHDTNFGINVIKSKCHHKKVLIVHDHLDKRDKLVKLAKKCEWFSPGSRIINNASRHPKVYYFYEMKEMDQNRAIQIFNRYAFESNAPPCEYDKITREIVKITGGLPLSLVVIGSSLYLESEEVCDDVLAKLKKKPHKEVQEVLKVSYDRLEYEHKEIFLDVACHMAGERRSNSIFMWSACQLYPNEAIPILINKSLIKIKNNHIWTHDQLKDLGRELVCRESIKNPREQSRIWCTIVPMDVIRKKEVHIDQRDFQNLLLELRWLSWKNCPSEALHLMSCRRLIKTPNFSTSFTFERLVIKNCHRLVEIDPSITMLQHLKHLEIKGCILLWVLKGAPTTLNLDMGRQSWLDSLSNLKRLSTLRMENLALLELPNSIGEIPGLQVLSLCNSFVKKLPESIRKLKNLVKLIILSTNIIELLDSIGELKRLEIRDMEGCKLRKLPKTIGMLKKLEELDSSICIFLEGEIPMEIGELSSLKEQNLSGTHIYEVPPSISRLSQLTRLTMELSSINIIVLFSTQKKSTLTELVVFRLPSSTFQSLDRGPPKIERLSLFDLESTYGWSNLHTFKYLFHFAIWRSCLTEIPLDVLGQLENLRQFDLLECQFLERLSHLPSLRKLRLLYVELTSAQS